MRTKIFATLMAVTVLLPMVGSKAFAIPAWSRRYKAECSMCHWQLYKLNGVGKAFLERGHRLPDEDATTDGKLLPLDNYLSAQVHADFVAQSRAFGDPSTFFTDPDLNLMAGGPLTSQVSFFARTNVNSGDNDNIYGAYNFGQVPGLQVRMGLYTPYVFRETGFGPWISLTPPFRLAGGANAGLWGAEANFLQNKWLLSFGISDPDDSSNVKDLTATAKYVYGPNGSSVGAFAFRRRTPISADPKTDTEAFGFIANYLTGQWELDAGVAFGTASSDVQTGSTGPTVEMNTNLRNYFIGGDFALTPQTAVYGHYEYQEAGASGFKSVTQGPVVGISQALGTSGRVALEAFFATNSRNNPSTARELTFHWDLPF